MRRIGFTVRGNAFRQPAIPSEHSAHANQFVRRRLEDDIDNVFDRACAVKDFERAADLLELLEKFHARRSASYGRERRINRAALERARQKLRQLRG